MAPLILLAVLLAVAGLLVLSVVAAFFKRNRLARVSAAGSAAFVSAYAVALVTINPGASAGRGIPVGEPLPFCGFYLDCHMSAAVLGVERAKSLGVPPYVMDTRGAFHIVTVRIANSARRATLSLGAPTAWVEGISGERFLPSPLTDSIGRTTIGAAPALNQPVPPGGSFTTTLVFDLPPASQPYRLHLAESGIPDRFLERLLLGDSDALFGNPSWFELP